MIDWQPIESAPKDGTRFLAYGEAYAELAERGDMWNTADTNKPRKPLICVAWWFELWYDDEVDLGNGTYTKQRKLSCAYWKPHAHAFHPTHWMPLPESPPRR